MEKIFFDKQEVFLKKSTEKIELTYDEILLLLDEYKKYGDLYHGTSMELNTELLPPSMTNVISETGRKKNLDKIFFTKDLKSAKIYAQRAKNSFGGKPRVYKVLPFSGDVEWINKEKGSTVICSSKVIILTENLEKILKELS